MTDKEKVDSPEFHVRGGYLKTIEYKDAWKKAWDEANKEDKELLFKLPNFDADVFEEITGINVKKSTHTITIDGKGIELSEESFQAFKKQFQ